MPTDRARQGGGREYSLTASASYTPFENQGWFGPGMPLDPTAQQTQGRLFDYAPGINISTRARAYEPVQFGQLRAMADGYDLLRLIIETVKDRICSQAWNIVPRDPKVKLEGDLLKRCRDIETFLQRPDREHFWDEWLRMVLEDLLVIDAPTIHRRRTRGGALYSLDVLDGSTIKRVIDDLGRTPEPPSVAYQQILKGIVASDYTSEELIYRPRNLRVHKLYGFSPVEQTIMTVNIALRRQLHQLAYFTEGNMPEALIGTPETWSPDQIKQFQDWFDGMLAGNTGERRRARFVPSAVGKTFIPTKNDELFGAGEEWLARMICFSFGISPLPFVKMMNRATGEQQQDQSDAEGTGPLKRWVSNLINTLLIDDFGSADLVHRFLEEDQTDPKEKAETVRGLVNDGLKTRNEGRVMLGDDPIVDPEFDQLTVKVADGITPVSVEAEIARKKALMEAFPAPEIEPGGEGAEDDENEAPGADGGGGQSADGTDEAAKAARTGALAKADAAEDYPLHVDRPRLRRRAAHLTKVLAKALRRMGDDFASHAEQVLLLALGKSADDIDFEDLLRSLDVTILEDVLDEAAADLGFTFGDSGRIALGQVGATIDDLTNQVAEEAVEWARLQAAQLVGTGTRPGYAIDDATREMLRSTITTGLADNLGSADIADMIQDSYAFSPERAERIALTEIARANSEGALAGYRAAAGIGIDVRKEWLIVGDACPSCVENAAQGAIPLNQSFQSGDDSPPAHPNCRCVVAPVVGE